MISEGRFGCVFKQIQYDASEGFDTVYKCIFVKIKMFIMEGACAVCNVTEIAGLSAVFLNMF